MTGLEKRIYSKIMFSFIPKRNCEKKFNKLVEISTENRFKKSKLLTIKKNKNGVTYDSPYEREIIEDLDDCTFVKKIKTQSLIITYKSKLFRKTKKYYPDIQILLDDGRIAIIEVKPFKEMVNKHNIMKHEALEKYCKKNRYGYAIFDYEYYSFEDLKKEKVSTQIQSKFINFVKKKKEVTFNECNNFKKENKINDYQICYIIWKNRNKNIKYQQHKIIYNEK